MFHHLPYTYHAGIRGGKQKKKTFTELWHIFWSGETQFRAIGIANMYKLEISNMLSNF